MYFDERFGMIREPLMEQEEPEWFNEEDNGCCNSLAFLIIQFIGLCSIFMH